MSRFANPLIRRLTVGLGLVLLVLVSASAGAFVDQRFPDVVPVLGGAQRGTIDDATLNAISRDIRAYYYYPNVNYTRLSQESAAAMVKGLGDPHTMYLTPQQYRAEQQSYANQYTGLIGVYVVFSGAHPTITGVIANSPAERAGIQPGDVVLTIDGRSTRGMSENRASGLIRGKPGTTVVLGIQRKTQTLSITVHRANFTSPTVISTKLPGDILYMRIYEFGDTTAQEFTSQLKANLPGIKGLILDLRDNGGGYVSAARTVISSFVSSGEAFSTKGRSGDQVTDVTGKVIAPKLPIVILVNRNTASASEITSGSLRAHGRAVLVGTRTYGKGSVQEDFTLPDGGDLHLTIEHWFLPNGKSIQSVGLKPNYDVNLPTGGQEFDVVDPQDGYATDTQLKKALALLGG